MNQLKYGRVEAERRFLVAEFPASLAFDRRYRIEDRYISQSRLRLRRMEDADGAVAYKLARKLPPHGPGQGVMGNLYLDEGEYRLLKGLDAQVIKKTRHYSGSWGVDVFEGELKGLILAESEAENEAALRELVPPFAVVREVTESVFFTGGRLAGVTAETLAEVLRGEGIWASS